MNSEFVSKISEVISKEDFTSALSSDAAQAKCIECGEIEWVISFDSPIDDVFLANYYCDDCDA